MTSVSSWGRLSADPHHCIELSDPGQVARLVAGTRPGTVFGMGRSYGDCCLNPDGSLWLSRGLNHLIGFDDATGVLVCESGVLLQEIQRLMVPRGWILPVTPGTQLITVGGAIANDVHGKNHHVEGSFGHHVRWLRLQRTDGEVVDCGPDLRPDWYAATVGGIGLTGIIVTVALQLKRVPGPWMDAETIPYASLDEFFDLADGSEAEWEHTVSWIDCLAGPGGRGLFMRANHAACGDSPPRPGKPITMPVVPPLSLVNKLSLRPFNFAYFQLNKYRAGRRLTHYEGFSYPLDNLNHWNRMYGPRGFFQYQCVIPRSAGKAAVASMLEGIGQSGEGSFLAVLKTFGKRESKGWLSFPEPGVTLALDFPNRGELTHRLFGRLDSIVRESGGRLYLAKDARMPRELFEQGYPRLSEFVRYRDPGISSAMSRRLLGS